MGQIENRRTGLAVLSCVWLGALAWLMLDGRWDVSIGMVLSCGLGGAISRYSDDDP